MKIVNRVLTYYEVIIHKCQKKVANIHPYISILTNYKFSLTETPYSSITHSSILCVFEIAFALMSQNSNIVCDMIYVWKIKIYLESVLNFVQKGGQIPILISNADMITNFLEPERGRLLMQRSALCTVISALSLYCIKMGRSKLHRQQLCSLFNTFGL